VSELGDKANARHPTQGGKEGNIKFDRVDRVTIAAQKEECPTPEARRAQGLPYVKGADPEYISRQIGGRLRVPC